jgi:CRISPR-associated protein (TIGR03986 family)
MTVHAPFRFARIHRWVHFPAWGPLASHDIPFADGLSGVLALDIEAETPILVGGPRRKATEDQEGEVWPYRLPDGRYALPGSALQGLFRSILEIAGFGQLGRWIDDRRFGIRDLTDAAKRFYRDRLTRGQVKAGFLQSGEDQRWTISPCKLKRIRFANIPPPPHGSGNFAAPSTAPERYSWLASTGPYAALGDEFDVTLNASDHARAWLVVTGNTGARKAAAKKKEFVFEETDDPALEVASDVKRDFRYIHEGGGTDDTSRWNPTWVHFCEKGYAKGGAPVRFDCGGAVPVFYIEEQKQVASFGLAYMFKLAHAKSTHDLLSNSTPDQIEPEAVAERRLDLASLIFGAVAEDDGRWGLKRRASFDLAVATLPANTQTVRTSSPTVLLSPKPSYFPIYVRQAPGPEPDLLPGPKQIYATYTPIDGLKPELAEPELSGVKVWPARPKPGCHFPNLPKAPSDVKKSVQVHLNALPAGTKFRTQMRFHNLRPAELGALLWAASFGDEQVLKGGEGRYRHRIGMGKPYGMGQVKIGISATESYIVANAGSLCEPRTCLPESLRAFVDHMRTAYSEASATGRWAETAQVAALLKAADPTKNRTTGVEFDYMALKTEPAGQGRQGHAIARSSYLDEKSEHRFLAPYVEGGEIPRRPRPGAPSSAPRPQPPGPDADLSDRRPAVAGSPSRRDERQTEFRPGEFFRFGREIAEVLGPGRDPTRVRVDLVESMEEIEVSRGELEPLTPVQRIEINRLRPK